MGQFFAGLGRVGLAVALAAAAVFIVTRLIVSPGGSWRGGVLKMWNVAAHWVALVMAFSGGVMLWKNSWAQWALHLSWVTNYLWWATPILALVLIGVVLVDLLADQTPDAPAIIATFLLPIVIAAGVIAFPRLWSEITGNAGDWSHSVQSNVGGR